MIFTPTKCCLKHCEKWSLKDYSDYRFHLMLHYTRPGQAFLFIEGQGFPSISGCPGRLAPRPCCALLLKLFDLFREVTCEGFWVAIREGTSTKVLCVCV